LSARVLKDMNYDDYVRLPGERVSDLSGFARTPLHARYRAINPKDDTASTIIGTALHTAILEPSKFLSDYAVAPKLDKRTREGKAAWAEFETTHAGGRIALRHDEMEGVCCMASAVMTHPFVERLFSLPSLREAVVVWEEPVNGTSIPCKARIDMIVNAKEPLVVDFKSCRDASADAFSKAIQNFSYHSKAASYLRGLQWAAPKEGGRKFLWVAVENSAPYGVAVYEASEGLLAQGEEEYRSWVRQFEQCKRTESWPGYPTAVMPIDLPKWAQRSEVE
jgi:hypothetical protein